MEKHQSVMLNEVLSIFENEHLPIFFDGTLGAGGHAEALLNAHPEIACYIGCDQDPYALEIAAERLKEHKSRLMLFHGNNADLDHMLASVGIDAVNGFFLI